MPPVSTIAHPVSAAAGVRQAFGRSSVRTPGRTPSRLYGVGLTIGLGMLAWLLGTWAPLIGGPVFGILLGMLVRNTMGVSPVCAPGIAFSARQVLQWSVVGLGFGLSLPQVVQTGSSSLMVTGVTLTVAFVSAWWLGRCLGLSNHLKTLIGVGTAICGGSAIAAVAPIIKPDDHDTALAISTIFLFNIVAVLLFPLLGHMLGMSDLGFGLWAGTAINDTSSVVAAGYSYSVAAGDFATIVKLTRATLIIPICVILAGWVAWRARNGSSSVSLARIFPWFILWFLVASGIQTMGWVPEALAAPLHTLAQFLIIMALTAIGLSSDLRRMARAGARPIMLGLGVWMAVALSSLAMQALTGTW